MKYSLMAILFCISILICGCLEGIETPPWSKERVEKLKADKVYKAKVSQTEKAGVSPFLILPI